MPESQRQQQKSLTRKNIMDTALELYARQGVSKTRTIDVARAANVSHGTIFAHFKTQEDLLIAVIDEFDNRINSRLHELAQGRNTLREVLQAHLEGLMEFEGFYSRLIVEKGILPESVQNALIMIQSTVSFHISKAIEKSTVEASIPKLPLHLIFNGWIGLIHYYLSNGELFSPGKSVIQTHGKELLDYYVALVTGKEE